MYQVLCVITSLPPMDLFTFGPWFACCQILTNCPDSGMLDSSGASLLIRYGLRGGLKSLELTIMVRTTMVGLVDQIL
jgi:hypothetical protein